VKKFLIFLVLLAIVAGIIWKMNPPWLQKFTATWIKASGIVEATDPSGRMVAAYYYTGTTAADAETCVNLRHAGDTFYPRGGVVFRTKGAKEVSVKWVSEQLLHIDVTTLPDDYFNSNFDGVTIECNNIKR
jgi:hypothetical protein